MVHEERDIKYHPSMQWRSRNESNVSLKSLFKEHNASSRAWLTAVKLSKFRIATNFEKIVALFLFT